MTNHPRSPRFPRTKAERQIRSDWWRDTMFEFMDDTTQPFIEQLRWNIGWYRDHTEDAAQRYEKILSKMDAEAIR